MKERLLGAAVLVIAAVVIIPALLDGPPRVADEPAREIELPAAAEPVRRTHVVDVDGAGAAPSDTEPAPPASRDSVAPAQPKATMPARDAANVATAPARPDPAPPQAAEPDQSSGWAVQVGSFSSETNARRLAGLLTSSGYPAFVARNVVDGRVMYRVRVGPETDRERAEALAQRLRDDRRQAQLVRHP